VQDQTQLARVSSTDIAMVGIRDLTAR